MCSSCGRSGSRETCSRVRGRFSATVEAPEARRRQPISPRCTILAQRLSAAAATATATCFSLYAASQLASLLVSQTDHLSTLSQAAHNDNGLPIRVPFNCSLEQANDISTRLIHRYQQLPDASVSLYEYRDHINTALVVSTSSDRPDVDFPCQISRSPILVEVAAWLCRQGTQ